MDGNIGINNLDKKILYELSQNCRKTDSKIGKKLRRSKQVIRYRIRRLEEEGFIQSYSALIDFRALGFDGVRIYLKFRNISPVKEEEIYNKMKEDDLFLWTVNLEGDVDIGFYAWIKDISNFYDRWEKFFGTYRKYILRQELYLSKSMVHYPVKILTSEKSQTVLEVGGVKEETNVDKKDYEILKILSRHANSSLVDIASSVGISAKLVSYRIKQLEKKKVILAYNAIIDEKKLGYKMYKVDFYLLNHTRLEEMYEFARTHLNIKNLMKTIGGPDYEIEVLVKDVIELRKLIDEIMEKFSDVVDYWRYNRFVKTIKQVYFPIGFEEG
ncbi:MAG: Lrp/AsnC family transcriptional regulator [Nanoarchaeota archaeon]|nr:Lrp/AsnC family transcriptional regulator [Nanoarchaeota archaeon]